MRKGRIIARTLLIAVLVALPGASVAASGARSTSPPGHAAVTYDLDDWPAYMHDPGRSGANGVESDLGPGDAKSLHPVWNFSTSGAIAAQPVVVNGTVYVGSWNGYEYALNESTGAEIWGDSLGTGRDPHCGATNRGITSTPTVVNGVVYVGAGSGWWYALNALNGSVLWRIFLGNVSEYYNWGSPLLVNGYAYIGISSACDSPLVRGAVWMVSLATHATVHVFFTVPRTELGASIWSSPTYDRATNTVFVTTGNGKSPTEQNAEGILALNATTLQLESRWRVKPGTVGLDSDFGATAALFPGPRAGHPLVGAVDKNGVFYALNRTNLSLGPLWTFRIALGGSCPECGQGSISSAANDGSALFVAGGATVLAGVNYSGSVAALNPGTGALLWQRGLEGPVIPAVTYAHGLVFVGAGTKLVVLNASSGTVLYKFALVAPFYAAASVADGCVFAGSTSGTVYALAPTGVRCSAATGIGEETGTG